MTWVPTIMMGMAGAYAGWYHLGLESLLLGLFTFVAGAIRGYCMAQKDNP